MIPKLTPALQQRIDSMLGSMSLTDKAAQVLAWNFNKPSEKNLDCIDEMLEKYPLGSIFIGGAPMKLCEIICDRARSCGTGIPVAVTADLVYGAGCRMAGAHIFSHQMAIGAANSEELAYNVGVATAREGRSLGVHWTFSPVVDLNIHPGNPMMHSRCFGENPVHVARLARAYIRGIQSERLMAASAKHFPGDGVEERDSHVCTTINSLSEEEWMDTYGYVWQEVIDEGVMAIMAGHIALPWCDPSVNYLGPPPGTFSYKIQHDLLRDRLGFQGAIVSDAISMVGYSCHMRAGDRAPGNIRAGSDLVLYADPDRDVPAIVCAVEEKRLTEERLTDAARRVLELKARVGLLDESMAAPKIDDEERRQWHGWATQIAEKSICIVRNENNAIPVRLKPGARVLTISSQIHEPLRGSVQELDTIDEELRARGFIVDHLFAPKYHQVIPIMHDYDAIFVTTNVPPRYGTTRFFGSTSSTFWESFWHDHPCVVFTCLCDPYKIYEMPYLPNCINAFSNTPPTQRAVVKVWLGEIEAAGKSPVRLEGFFDMEV
ncbi:MAG: hypothetical protein GF350_09410 [Chitinivibrionales bacterium]|nr:hypothetical protein [Chitinivibrionales bacterium]